MMLASEAEEAWWPPTLTPSRLSRPWLALWMVQLASHSTLRSSSCRIARSSGAGILVSQDIVFSDSSIMEAGLTMAQSTRWCRFRVGDTATYGLIDGGRVVAVSGSPFGEHTVTSTSFPLASVKLLVPVIPPTFFCVGVNYADHVRRMAEMRGTQPVFPKRPDIGYRANNALIAHEESIVKPRDAGPDFQYEGELVAVFGKAAKNVSREKALDCVFGW